MNLKDDLSPGDIPNTFNVVVEIPKGSNNKYEYDEDTGVFKLDRVLYSPMFYPGDYGFIPQTLADDGDPMDVLILVTNPSIPGMVIECKPLALMEFIDQGEGDDKILAVPVDDPRFADWKDISDIPQHTQDEVTHFFATYKDLEKKKVEVKAWHDAAKAKEVLQKSVENYQNK